jgi:hypothetical protein
MEKMVVQVVVRRVLAAQGEPASQAKEITAEQVKGRQVSRQLLAVAAVVVVRSEQTRHQT